MPQLPQDESVIKKFVLPTTKDKPEPEQGWVEVRVGKMVGGDMMNITGDHAGGVPIEVLVGRMVSWNYTELDGTPAKINLKTISRLDLDDIKFLLEQIDPEDIATATPDPLNDSPKKNEPSSNTSTP